MTIHEDILEYAAKMECGKLHMFTDTTTELKAIIAIHNTNLGPSLGGCRLVEYANTQQAAIDAIRLAQGMSYKSAIAGLNLGGGKAVLLKPKHEIKREQYFKSFGRFVESLQGQYITAVDMGTSVEDMDLVSTETSHVTSTSCGSYSFSDPSPITALGVYECIRAAIKFKFGLDNVQGIKVGILGVGHVGYNLAKLLVKDGAVVTIADLNKAALTHCTREVKVSVVNNADELFKLPLDVLSPCGAGASLNAKSIPLIQAPIIVGAANNQLETIDDAQRLYDQNILYAPDFVVNAGGIIYVAGQYFSHSEAETKEKVIKMYDNLLNLFTKAEEHGVLTNQMAYALAKERIYGTSSSF